MEYTLLQVDETFPLNNQECVRSNYNDTHNLTPLTIKRKRDDTTCDKYLRFYLRCVFNQTVSQENVVELIRDIELRYNEEDQHHFRTDEEELHDEKKGFKT